MYRQNVSYCRLKGCVDLDAVKKPQETPWNAYTAWHPTCSRSAFRNSSENPKKKWLANPQWGDEFGNGNSNIHMSIQFYTYAYTWICILHMYNFIQCENRSAPHRKHATRWILQHLPFRHLEFWFRSTGWLANREIVWRLVIQQLDESVRLFSHAAAWHSGILDSVQQVLPHQILGPLHKRM